MSGRFRGWENYAPRTGSTPEKCRPGKITHAKGNAAGGKRTDLGNRFFRSKWEANYARYLNILQASGVVQRWEYEPKEFAFPVERGARFYRPDFRVFFGDGSAEWVEIKGYLDPTSKTKLRRMAEFYPNEKIKLIFRAEMASIKKRFGGANWE